MAPVAIPSGMALRDATPAPAEIRARLAPRQAALLDVREAYRRIDPAVGAAVHVPLGLLLADPERARSERPWLVLALDREQAAFASSYLRRHGIEASPLE